MQCVTQQRELWLDIFGGKEIEQRFGLPNPLSTFVIELEHINGDSTD